MSQPRELTMKSHTYRNPIVAMAAMALAFALAGPAHSEVADLADVPLANSPSDAVLPNLMYTLDDSGSMSWDFMPDNVHNGPGAGGAKQNCKSCDSSSCSTASTMCSNSPATSNGVSTWGEPPYFSAQFNQVYYNPDVSYGPGVNSAATSLGNISPTAAPNDAYLDAATTKDLTTTYPEIYYCTTSSPSAADLTNTAVCRRNGINNQSLGYFLYWKTSLTDGGFPYSDATASDFRYRTVQYTGNPYYFRVTPHEHCSDADLINCTLSATPTGSFTQPAPLRYCNSTANAASTAVMSDPAGTAAPKCRKQFSTGAYFYPRYGRFTRVDIVSSTTTYPKSATAVRPDCANAAYCTYAEELQNFANWYGYYRTRMMMMKTATGRAFIPIDDRYRVGFITINPGNPVVGSRYEPLGTFDATQKSDFYTKLYDTGFNGSTPLRQALSRVGRHYAGITTGINSGMPEDPITHSCQQNFALLTTDGYWNDSGTVAIQPNGSAVDHQDQIPDTVDPIYVSRPTVTLDGEGTQTRDTTPLTVLQQVVCTGDSSVLGGTNNCDCTGSYKRVKQRTQAQSQTTDKTDGQITSGPNTTTTSTTYQDITACDARVDTEVTPVNVVEVRDCRGNGSTGTFTYGGSQTCTCSGTREVLFRQTIAGATRTRILVDGVVTSDTVTGGTTTWEDSVGGAFSPLPAATGGSCSNSNLNDSGPTITNTGPTVTTSTGSTITSANITISPNPKTTAGTTTTTVTAYGGAANTLADVAMYYYKNDLRTGAPTSKSDNNVPTSDKDINDGQHMVTFGLGLGLKGLMDYSPDYESNPNSDFAKIRTSATTCSWTSVAGRTCNWPLPSSSSPSTLDDLWHAAVNGRGVFYSASDPNTLADGLAGALAALKTQTAAASASATSSPNITETDNYIYSSTFRTVKWDGQIVAQQIDPADGTVIPTIVWAAQEELDLKVSTAEAQATPTDGRTIKTFLKTAATKLKDFTWANLTAAEQAHFSNKCIALSQCPLLTLAQQADANNGQFMVEYLRGRTTHEGTVFRLREHRLGDPVNATPAFVKAPRFNFGDSVTPTYATFRTANASRQGVLYIAANDGMLHAFNGDSGDEIWAYVPRIVFPDLHNLATDNWDVRHEYNVDGSPQVMDVFDSSASAWKTILVAGLNKGGRGFYALDVTDPNAPKGLWEICHDILLCAIADSDMGYSYGYPVITKRASDGRWVVLVTSGINNISPGTGRGYLYVLDAFTGAILQKVDTGVGDLITPSGFSKISGFANNFNVDNTSTFVYGGDLLGNLWRFDMSVNPPAVLKMAELKDGSGNPQSITSRPELGIVENNRVVFVGTGRYLGEDDLPDPATLVPPLAWAYQQSFYAIKDRNVAHGNIRSAAPGLVQQTITALSASSRTISTNSVDWSTKDGWFVDFNPGNASPGERVNLDPQLVLGTLVVATNVPNNTACSVGGDSWLYQFDYQTGQYVPSAPDGQVAQKLTGETLVGVVVVRLPSGVLKAIATGATGTKRTLGVNVGGGGGSGRRASWRELIQ
jgi:type IV pilus assembly protein PilY1